MSAAALITRLHKLGIQIRTESGELRIKAPKGVMTVEIQAELKRYKDELLELLDTGRGESTSLPPVGKMPSNAEPLLSFSQQRLWFLDRLEPGKTVYNIPLVMRLKGELDSSALEAAFNDLIARHEALRTTFATTDDEEPIINIAVKHTARLDTIDLSGADDEKLQEQLETLNAVPFDIAKGPLIRMHLVRVSEQEHVLMLLMHHIISDAWSLNIISSELVALYSEHTGGEPAKLADLPLQYSDYAYWQRQYLQGEELERQLGYWRKQLSGAPAMLELPTDNQRPAVPTNRGGRVQQQFSRTLSYKLNSIAQSEKATLFMLLLAAADILLARYTNQTDIVVGTPIAGRERTELEGLIGFFINNLVMRTDVSGNPTFRELLGRTRDTALEAYDHQALPFERLVEELQPDRNLSHAPIFQVLFMLQNAPGDGGTFAGLEATGLGFDYGTAKFDLTIATVETDHGIAVEFEYNKDLFEHKTIERMLAHFEQLLEGIAGNPDCRVNELAILSEAERRQLLVDWNSTEIDYPEHTLQTLTESQVARTPGAVAIEYDGESITYEEFNSRANQLAHVLMGRGVGPESLVGVLLERSAELVITLHAIEKAGGAYVPLDPDYPQQRLEQILEDAQLDVLVTEASLQDRIAFDNTLLVSDPEITAAATNNPEARASENSLAYVIFTSGSTGRPKGVMNEHRGIVNRLLWMQSEYQLDTSDRVLQKTPFSFDVSVWEFFWPLMTGARLVVAKPGGHKDPDYLAELINTTGVTTLHFVPSMLQLFLQQADTARCNSIKRVICSGEALPLDLTQRFFSQLPSAGLHNLYGPTEAAIDVTYWACEPDSTAGFVPIGRPVANTSIYIVDETGNPVPVGVPGELWIGGIQVARGYINRPELTAERFIADPFSDSTDARIYRTGDLVRYRDDGRIEFLGRIDHQIKLRGFRIELGEIEAVLDSMKEVDQSVVVLHGKTADEQKLVAYVTGSDVEDTVPLRDALAEQLPEYMVPAVIMPLDTLPLTASGKVDRKQLPEPVVGTTQVYIAPRNELEETLADIWAEILGVERIGVRDDFFALGGHSLLAAKATGRIRTALGREIALRLMFTCPTIDALAKELADETDAETLLPPLTAQGATEDVPLSYAQQRIWFFDQFEPGNPAYNVPWALRLQGKLDRKALTTALNSILQRHDILRATFSEGPNGPVQSIRKKLPIEVEYYACQNHTDEQIAEQLTLLSKRSFDLTTGPLLRAHILQHDDTDQTLLFVLHHIAADNASIAILQTELAALYNAIISGNSSPLPPQQFQYTDYALWQQDAFSDGVLDKQIDYWLQQLDGAPALLELPADKPRPAIQTYDGSARSRALSAGLQDKLNELAQQHGATPFMVLLSVFNILLNRYSGADDLVIGTPIMGRNREELENVVGIFLNSLAIRSQLDNTMSFEELLGTNRETILNAYANQDLPFELLVEKLQLPRDLSHPPVFQIMFTLHNRGEGGAALAGLQATTSGLDYGSAKFDLSLSLTDTGDGFIAHLEYNTDLFLPETIDRLLAHYENLLAAVVSHPQEPVAGLQMLGQAEQQQLLNRWNDTGEGWESADTLHGLFEVMAQVFPDKTAVSGAGQNLTYAELDRASGDLAKLLSTMGAGPDVPVAVCLERSPNMLVCMLAVLRSGSGYVPLDPNYPTERIEYMLDDSRCQVLLTESDLIDRLPVENVQAICVDDPLPSLDHIDALESAGADNLAYQIYTSGSTGKPKGVQIEHKAVVNFLQTMAMRPGFTSGDTLLAVTTLCFDISVLELFLPLVTGGTVVIATQADTADGQALAGLLAQHPVTVMQATPATWRLLLSSGWQGNPNLTVLCGGEALSRDLADTLSAGNKALWNMYGPTETTIWSTCHQYQSSDPVISVGRPIANTQVYVLNDGTQPMPVGVPGELFIGGDGVARGYWQRDELNAERFIGNPFDEGRMYRTGDLARWCADGTLEVLGRTDFQVKLRGFRIELGEIETALGTHGDVTQAVVTLREDQPGDQRLVAYAVAPDGVELGPATLREHLSGSLPDYMLPAAYVQLDKFPLTPNGKIDRKALPAPDAEQVATTEYVAPRNDIEKALCVLWSTTLGLPRIGIHDDFFMLGGHSLLATQLVSKVRDELGVELRLKDLFETPRVAAIAKIIDTDGMTQVAALEPWPRDIDVPLSYAQQRLWFLDQMEPGTPVYNMPFAIRLKEAADSSVLQQAITGLVQRHEVLRSNFVSGGDEPTQIIHDDTAVELELSEAGKDRSIADILADDAAWRFDLAEGALIRFNLIREAGQGDTLSVVIHHIIADGWSWNVLLDELMALYDAIKAGNDAGLPELPIQYADYCHWERELLQGEELQRQLDHWSQHLEGAPALLELPTDRPRPAVQTYNGAHITRFVGDGLSETFNILARREGATLYMALLAAFNILLARFAGQDDIVVGMPIAGRQRTEFESLIGLFLNTLAVRTDLSGNPSFRQLLQQVRRTTLDAYANQDLPFEKLVEELQPARDLSHTPVFQVMFNLHNEYDAGLYADFTEEVVESERVSAKFDLTVAMAEVDDQFWIDFEYNTDLFDRATVAHFMDCFEVLLRALGDSPELPLSDLELFERPEHLPAFKWPGAAPDPQLPASDNIADAFFAAADVYAERTAVDDGKKQTSYRELNALSDRVASGILRHAAPGKCIALLLGHDVTMVASVLGVLKSGCNYLPLDPKLPPGRLQTLLAEGKPYLLVTDDAHSKLASQLAQHGEFEVMNTAKIRAQRPKLPDIDPETHCYTLFTSGSTGTPKGVIQTHRNVLHHASAYAEALRLTPDDRLSLFSNYAYDASVQDIFGALIRGACVCPIDLREEELGGSLTQLADLDISVFHATPTVFRFLFENADAPHSLRLAVLGGEKVRPADFELFKQRFAEQAVFINGYGLTEYTANLQYFADKNTPLFGQQVPAGNPVGGAAVELVDRSGSASAICGEILIRSDYLFRGYLNHTADDAMETGTYLTGDLAKRLPDGQIVIKGRRDHQIKIRGYRVETAEIETALKSLPGIKDAVVIPHDRETENTTLIAYLESTRDDGSELDTHSLREALRDLLPSYMLPTAFVELDAIPVTPTGKIDRRALPAYNPARIADGEVVAPDTAEEKLLHGIWVKLLKTDDVGIHDNFFDLGGHSLMTIRMLRDIEQATGIALQIANIFEHPTIAELAPLLSESREAAAPRVIIPVRPEGSGAPLFMVHMDELNITWQLTADRPIYSLNLPYLAGIMPEMGAADLASLYADAIVETQPQGPYHLAGAGFGAVLATEIARQLGENGETVTQLSLVSPLPLSADAVKPELVHGKKRSKPLYCARINGLSRFACRLYDILNRKPPTFLYGAWNDLRVEQAMTGYMPVGPDANVLKESGIQLLMQADEVNGMSFWENKSGIAVSLYSNEEDLAGLLNTIW